MKNVLIVGDLHLKQKWVLSQVEKNMKEYDACRVVFLGDATNDWYATDEFEVKAMRLFSQWISEMRDKGVTVDVLLGNHDYCYVKGTEGQGTHFVNIPEVSRIFREEIGFKVAVTVGSYLCSHAGLTQRWAEKYLKGYKRNSVWGANQFESELNSILAEKSRKWNVLDTAGHARGGWDEPSPLWADLKEVTTNPATSLKQIVGHTPVEKVFHRVNEFKGNEFEIWGCDTMSLYGGNLKPIGNGDMLLAEFDFEIQDYKISPVPFNLQDKLAWEDAMWEYARSQGVSIFW